MVAGLDAAASDADFDPTLVQVTAAARVVVALVGVQLVGSTQGTTGSVAMSADAGVGLEQGLELHAVVGVRRRQQRVQDQTTSVDEQVVLRAGLAAVGRVPAGQLAPLFARTETLSTQPRDQSMSSASESSSSTRRCSRQTPVAPAPGAGALAGGLHFLRRVHRQDARFARRGPPVGASGAGRRRVHRADRGVAHLGGLVFHHIRFHHLIPDRSDPR